MTTTFQAILLSVLIASVLVAGCAAPPQNPVPAPQPLPPGPSPHPEPVLNGTHADASSVAEANNLLGLDLYAQLKDQGTGNLLFSPWSVTSALAMTQEGAKGATRDEMAQALHLIMPADEIRSSFQALDSSFNAPDKGFQLSSANAIWVQQGYPVLASFKTTIQDVYDGGVSNLDFVGKTEQSRQTINNWVADKTHDRIQDLIPQGAIDASTRLVLTNAVYFKAAWQNQFMNYSTTDEDFFAPDKTVTAKLMHQTAHFSYGETSDLQLLEMPYNGSDVSMLVILPKAKDGLPQLEQELTAENLQAWEASMKSQKVEVYLPRFNFTFGTTSLKGPLESLGMTLPFAPDADFSGMADFSKLPPDEQSLYISDVLHKAFIVTDEEGTEAAAATAVTMVAGTAMPGPEAPPPVFRADHPFLFLIRDNASGAILFMGRVNDPTAS